MSGHRHDWNTLLLAVLCAWPVATLAIVPPRDSASDATITHAAEFDATLQKVVGPTSMEASSTEYEGYLKRLKAFLPAGDKLRDAKFRSVYCGSRDWQDEKRGLAYSNEALKQARNVHDLASESRSILCRATFIMLTSGSQHGLPEFNKVVALLTDSKEQQLLAEALQMRGDTLSLLGEQRRAMIDFQRARAAYRVVGIDHEIESLMFSIAVGYRRVSDLAQAERYFTSAITRMQQRKQWEALANNYIQLGFLLAESGAPDKAQTRFRQAIDVATQHTYPRSVNDARLGLADTQITLGEPGAALDTLKQARVGFLALNDESANDMLLILTGQALAKQNKHGAALAYYKLALPLVQRNGNDRYLAMIYQLQATSEEALGKIGTALEKYKRYTDLQMKLQGKMRLEHSRMLEYEYEIRRRDFENRQLRADSKAKEQQVLALEYVRQWQALSLLLAVLFAVLLGSLAWRQWNKSRRLRNQAMTDPLTSVASRIGIEHEIEQAIIHALRMSTPLSLLMLDLDHFKSINDRYGHATGDRVLREVAATWHTQVRGRNALGRIGGEEFVVVCHDTSLDQALLVAARLHEAMHALRFDDVDTSLQVTVSIGAAIYKQGETRADLLAHSDAALYRAKRRGRDRIET